MSSALAAYPETAPVTAEAIHERLVIVPPRVAPKRRRRFRWFGISSRTRTRAFWIAILALDTLWWASLFQKLVEAGTSTGWWIQVALVAVQVVIAIRCALR